MGFLSRLFSKKSAKGSNASLNGHQMTSLVLLSESHISLTLESLREGLDKLFPGEFLPPRNSGNFVVDGPVKGATYMIMSNVEGFSGGFMLHTVPAPYDGFSNFKQNITDPTLATLVASHRCWLSVDEMFKFGTTEEHYRFIGLLISSLAPLDSVAVVHPSRLQTIPFTPEVREQLTLDGYSYFN